MSIYSEFDVEFNGNSPMNRNDPQQIEIFGPAGLEKNVNKSIAEFSSVLSLSAECYFDTSVSKSKVYLTFSGKRQILPRIEISQ